MYTQRVIGGSKDTMYTQRVIGGSKDTMYTQRVIGGSKDTMYTQRVIGGSTDTMYTQRVIGGSTHLHSGRFIQVREVWGRGRVTSTIKLTNYSCHMSHVPEKYPCLLHIQ